MCHVHVCQRYQCRGGSRILSQGGGAHLKNIAPNGERRENVCGISSGNPDFTPKNHILSNFREGGARRVRPPWIHPCNVSCKCVLEVPVCHVNACQTKVSILSLFLRFFYCILELFRQYGFSPMLLTRFLLLVLRDITQSDIRTCFTWGDNSCYLSKRFSIQIHVEIVSTLSLYNSIVYTCKT